MGLLSYYLEFRKRFVKMQTDFVRDTMRSAHPDKTDKELGIDQPFLEEQILYLYSRKLKK